MMLAMIGWLLGLGNHDEEDKSLIEISNAGSVHDVAEIPTSAVKDLEKQLKRAGIKKEDIDNIKGKSPRELQRIVGIRDPEELRYTVARIVDELEDHEPDDWDERDDWDECSLQGAERYWNSDDTRRNHEDAADGEDGPRYDIYRNTGDIERAAAAEVRRMIQGK